MAGGSRVRSSPSRETLRELEGSGLLRSERYRGTRVRGAAAKVRAIFRRVIDAFGAP